MTKEISKEVKAKVFGLYLGAECMRFRSSTGMPDPIDETITLTPTDFNNIIKSGRMWYYKLILSDLSDISDEDAVEVAKIVIGDSEDFTINKTEGVTFVYGGDYRLGIWADNDFIILDHRHATTHAPNVIEAIDYLRSRGYMLPAFGITDLFEAGIAVRKNKEV